MGVIFRNVIGSSGGMMVLFTGKQLLFSEFVAPKASLLVEDSSLRFMPQPNVGATCQLRYRCRPELRTQLDAVSTILGAYSSSVNAVKEGGFAFSERNRNINSSTRILAVAEAHNSQGSEDVQVSSDGVSVLADEVPSLSEDQRWMIVKQKISGLLSNAEKHFQSIQQIRHSLAVDFGDVKTGLAISLRGYAPRPLTVVRMRGDKLIEQLLEIATRQKADEFIVGLPRTFDGRETEQSNKTRSFAGRLAGQAALRGWRVYLLDEYGTSQDGLDYMLEMGVKKRSRKDKIDAYAALVLLSTYFNSYGARVQLVVPKGLAAQERLCLGSNLIAEHNLKISKVYDVDVDDDYEYDD